MSEVAPRGFIDVTLAPAAGAPARAALIVDGEVTTFAELHAAVLQAAATLAGAGVATGSRIALVDDAGCTSVAALLGAARIGAAAALMNPRLVAGELAGLIESAQAKAVGVAGPRYRPHLAEAGCAVVLSGTEVLEGEWTGGPWPDPAARDEAAVLFTSGTTGPPKPVPLTHGALSARITEFAPTFDPAAPTGVSLMCVPLVHIGGMLGLMVSLARGATTVVLTHFDAGEWLELVERHRVSATFVVPTMLHRILEHPSFPTRDLGSLQLLSYGAAPASPALIERAVAALPRVAFSNVFGQTETMGSITALTPADHRTDKVRSVGRPLPDVEVRIVDPDTAEELAVGEVGELWVRTSASAQSAAGVDDGEGWVHTGDFVSLDADGYLYPAGRLAETINRGGEKFSPFEIESVLARHPAVREVAVAGVADPEMGHRVGAAVVADGPINADELRAFCRPHLANFKLPERIVVVEEIPLNDFGKVARRRVADLITSAGEEP
jgi:acyl-CoA synthetase (AMP-forming)/AMP-acid ligase II